VTRPSGPSLTRTAGLVGSATMASRILGLVREQVLAHAFGASHQMDAFNVAFRLPNLVRDLFAEGAMTAAFVPTFSRTLTREGKDAAWTLGRRAITALLLVTSLIALVGMLFAEPMTRAFAGEFAAVPGKFELTVRLTRLMFPFLPLVAVSVAAMGMLNALGRFFVPALAPATFNLASIACILLLVPLMPALGVEPVTALAFAVVAGGLGQVLLQWPQLRAEGFRFRPDFAPQDPGLREILLLMGPGTLGVAATQFNVYVSTVLATSQQPGAVSWLNYAFRILYLPIGLFGVSIASASLPLISQHAAREDTEAVRRTVAHAMRLMLTLTVPASAGLLALAVPIVRVIFERGQFLPSDTQAAALALMAYAPGLVGYSAVKVLSPTFYALRDSRTPVVISVTAVLMNAALSLAFVGRLGYVGLALGTALASLLNAGLLLVLLRRRIGGIEARRLASTFVRIGIASAVMAGAAWGTHALLEARVVPGPGLVAQVVRVASAIGVALVVLVLAARALRIQEFDEAAGRLLRRLRGRGKTSTRGDA
jgi:putative peptidoglycan lipid II flippase